MSEGGLEDYIKTIINCENWNKFVYQTQDKERYIIENNKNTLENLEIIKIVYFKRIETMTSALYAYREYNEVLDKLMEKF